MPNPIVDCDVHAAVPDMAALMPYLDAYWREMVGVRALDRLNFALTSYPPGAPINCRPDWKPDKGLPGSDVELVRAHVFGQAGVTHAILNCLHGAQAFHSEDMAAVFCRAINQWLADTWLDRDPRFSASIVVPAQSPALAVEEIKRCAADHRFVQVLMLVSQELTLGRRYYWPIYETCAALGLPVGIHAGSTNRYAPTPIGWHSYHLEDYVAQALAFEAQLQSLIAEGVFAKYPELTVVCIESGLSWLPGYVWRADKTWRGVRAEVPWVKQAPSALLRRHVRFTTQPIDALDEAAEIERLVEILGADDLFLFASDYPHWRYDGDAALPAGLAPALARKIVCDTPLATYPRLKATADTMETTP
jgi:predicted TIM-barrel fold metal-dependent hydrolase